MPVAQTVNASSFESVLALIREVAESQKETDRQMKETDRFLKDVSASQKETERFLKDISASQKETDRLLKDVSASQKETDRQMKETDRQMKETDRKIDEYNKRFGDFTKRFGDVVEHLVAPNLCEKFKDFNLFFPRANSGSRFFAPEKNIKFEVDIMLENGDIAMLVEVKTKLTTEDVKDHIARLEKMRGYADLHRDKRSFLGAVAGVVIESNVIEYALKQGLFVIEPSGETFNITPPQGKPKEW